VPVAKEEKIQQVGTSAYAFWALALMAIAYGLYHAASLAWVNDDAFISFRYARNFINDLGLVYNAGERVEGYTNFLWTMAIAAGMKIGLDPVVLSESLGIAFFVLTLALFALLSWNFRPAGKGWTVYIPLTTLALCLHRDANVYATSGLETSMFTFFVSCGFALLLLHPSTRRLMLAGLILTLAVLTRPDGIVFFGISLAFVAFLKRPLLKSLWYVFLPFVVIYVPYWIWRYTYYGYFFPNTYYAKSADLTYYEQGIRFAALYIKTYYVFLLAPLLGGWLLIQRRQHDSRGATTFYSVMRKDHVASTLVLGVLFIVAYTWLVIRVGGDFMFARFLIPITPLAFFVLELLINRGSSRIANIVLCCLVLAATQFRNDQYRGGTRVDDVTDEWQFYPLASLEQAQRDGVSLKRYFSGLPVKIAFFGTQSRLMYYADPPVAIEAATGLTDEFIAHLPLSKRGVPGHEKLAPSHYLHTRGVHFMFVSDTGKYLDDIDFGGIRGRINIYDAPMMLRLANYPEVKFVSMPQYLDFYLKQLPNLPLDQVERDYRTFKGYYFDYNSDAMRMRPFLEVLTKR
jgi:hypothetical protein